MPIQIKELAGKPYRPSNGVEGEMFAVVCEECVLRGICKILLRSMTFDIDDERYPKQLIYDENGWPQCTSRTIKASPKKHRCKNTPDMFEGKK